MASPATKGASRALLLLLMVSLAAQASSQQRPDQLTDLSLQPAPRMIAASWRLLNPSGRVGAFHVKWENVKGSGEKELHRCAVPYLVSDRQQHSTEQCDKTPRLLPGSEYNVSLWRINHSSRPLLPPLRISGRTLPEEPSAPSSFTLVSSVHDMTATWNEPMEHNGVLGPYNVSWQCGANTAHKLVNTTVYTIKGLPSCAKCRVRVTASTAAGEGESSEATLWTQPEAPAPVTLQKSTTAGARTISLWWQRLSSKCNITSYYITYDGNAMWGEKNPHSASVVVQEGLVKTIYSYNLVGLVPYSRYNVCVAAGNQGGNSSVKCQEGFQTKQARPSTPSAFSVVTTAHTVSATWQEPQEHNGVLGPYNISWQCGANTSYELINTTVYTIEGLPAGVECRVRVAASTEAGEGERSEESVWIPSDPKLALIMGGTGATVLVTAVIVGGIILCRRGQARKMSRQRPTDKAVAETAPTTTATTIAVDAIANENDGDKSAITEAKEKRQLLNAPLPFRPMPPVPLEREPVNSNLESATGHDYYYVRPEDVKRAIVDETTPMMGNPEKIK